jgi:hypothetical protein
MYSVAQFDFKTLVEVKEHIHDILKEYATGQIISKQEHYEFIDALLHCHPRSKSKFNGSKFNQYRKTDVNGLNLIRDDNSETDISYMHCLKKNLLLKRSLSQDQVARMLYQDISRAFRDAIHDQINDFSIRYWRNKKESICPINEFPMLRETSHVDHEITFQTLVDKFLISNPCLSTYLDRKDNQRGCMIINEAYKLIWQEFHRKNAKLRVVHKFTNMSTLQIGRKKNSMKTIISLVENTGNIELD